MEERTLLPHLFRTEYRKIVSVLCYLFGIEHIETAEDIVSDTFLTATETWSINGIPENPTAWLYTVAKNKTKNVLKRHALFEQKLSPEIKYSTEKITDINIDLSQKNIADSQLAMMFTVCNPVISGDAQVALALNLLCGFGIQEIADAYLTSKEVIYKRISRAKEKLKEKNIPIEQPSITEINTRLQTVLTSLYLLFSEGYYSTSNDTILRKDVCFEAMRLCYLLVENNPTDKPEVNALFALMSFHASRFDARITDKGESILYDSQDESLWNTALIEQGKYFLNKAATGNEPSKYHLEAGIAYWHTQKEDTGEKWDSILQLYNLLLVLEYSPIAALNRTFALARVKGKAAAIVEAEKLQLHNNPFYYSLLGNLYTGIDNKKAIRYFETALQLSHSAADKLTLTGHLQKLTG
jgi:RNA polymerase sigma factor (sigma-70 family)